MGLDTRKPVFGDLGTTKAQTSLRICAVWSAPLLYAFWKVNFLASLCSWGDWFESRFFGNPQRQVLSRRGPYNVLLLSILILVSLSTTSKFPSKIHRGSCTSDHFIWNLLNEPLASLINLIWNNHECKILFIIQPLKCDFNTFKVCLFQWKFALLSLTSSWRYLFLPKVLCNVWT